MLGLKKSGSSSIELFLVSSLVRVTKLVGQSYVDFFANSDRIAASNCKEQPKVCVIVPILQTTR